MMKPVDSLYGLLCPIKGKKQLSLCNYGWKLLPGCAQTSVLPPIPICNSLSKNPNLPYIFGSSKNMYHAYMYIHTHIFHYLCIFPLPFYFNFPESLKKMLWNASVKLVMHPHSDTLSGKQGILLRVTNHEQEKGYYILATDVLKLN